MIKKILVLLSILTSYIASAGSNNESTPSKWQKNIDPTLNPVGENEMVLQFSNRSGVEQFFQENICANGVTSEIQSENDMVVDLSNCDVIDIAPDVEILAAGNVWDNGTIL